MKKKNYKTENIRNEKSKLITFLQNEIIIDKKFKLII